MRISRMVRRVLVAASLLGAVQSAGAQGKLFVSHDEWYTGPATMGANEQQLIHNTLNWMNALGGSALIYSSNTFLTNSTFLSYLGTQGMTTTVDPSAASFGSYSVVFVEGNPGFDAAGLGAYVLGGGNVVYIGGTGTGGAVGESAYSAPFLNQFGIVFSGVVRAASEAEFRVAFHHGIVGWIKTHPPAWRPAGVVASGRARARNSSVTVRDVCREA